MHILGLMGMPRRIYDYAPEMGWQPLNILATGGVLIATLGGLIFVANAWFSYRRGAAAGPDPWGGATLEWDMPSPPPPYNVEYVPVVETLTPLWDRTSPARVWDGPAPDKREVLITSGVAAEPVYRQTSAGPSIWPLMAAIATSVMFVGSIYTPWALVWGSPPIAAALTAWFWPRERKRRLFGRAKA
jgi:cytochrome c oxidase subunit I+III